MTQNSTQKKIDKKITGYYVKGSSTKSEENEAAIEAMHENIARPEILAGATYKIKTPRSDHALYITINDVILNPGTEHEIRRPFEIFINSKNLEHFQSVFSYMNSYHYLKYVLVLHLYAL